MDVERILNAVEHEFGTTINTKTDCVSLEQHIHEVTKERISYNTLRRALTRINSIY